MIKESRLRGCLNKAFFGISLMIGLSIGAKNLGPILGQRSRSNTAGRAGFYIEDIVKCRDIYGDEYYDPKCLVPYKIEGALQTNSKGIWGDEIEMPKPEGVYRVACIGGSTTAGNRYVEYVEAWPESLQKVLDDGGEPIRYESINFGLAGTGSRTALKRFKITALDFDPDMAVLYSGWNDVKNCSFFSDEAERVLEEFLLDGDEDKLVGYNPWFKEHLDFWRQRREQRISDVKAFARLNEIPINSVDAFREANNSYIETYENVFQGMPASYKITEEDFEKLEEQRLSSVDMSSPFAQIPLELMVGNYYTEDVKGFVESALSNGVKPVLVTIHGKLDCENINIYDRKCYGFDVSENDMAAFIKGSFHRLIRKIGSDYDVPVVDTFSHFESMGVCDYFHDMEHPNREGYLEIAKLIAEEVRKDAMDKNEDKE